MTYTTQCANTPEFSLSKMLMRTLKAAVFVEQGKIILDEKPIPSIGLGDDIEQAYELFAN